MWKTNSGLRVGWVRAGVGLGWLALVPLVGVSQALPEHDDYVHLGVASCASSQCHGSAIPRTANNVLQSEYVTWSTADPHAGAYRTLLGQDSRAIAQRLGLGNPEESPVCLGCHADYVPPARRGEQFQLADGVTCEACHGGAETWLAPHYNDVAAGHAGNVRAGLYPADAVESRAALCLSCHLGTQDKLATHEIMAAGHPRLAFELDTFTELWRLAGSQPHYQVDADYRQRKQAADHVTTWIAGLVASARQQLALLSSPMVSAERIFPELALFDCHACHRTMKDVRWRALPRFGGVGPGATVLNDSSFVMLAALASAVDSTQAGALAAGVQGLHRAASSGVGELRAAASALAATLDRLQRELAGRSIASSGKRRLLVELLQAGSRGELVDYVAAEQTFMAVQMLAYDLEDDGLAAALESLAAALEDDESYQPDDFAALLQSLR